MKVGIRRGAEGDVVGGDEVVREQVEEGLGEDDKDGGKVCFLVGPVIDNRGADEGFKVVDDSCDVDEG